MAGIVGSGRQLVDQQFAFPSEEKFDTQHSDNIELFKHPVSDFDSLTLNSLRHVGRSHRQIKNMILMGVLDDPPMSEGAVQAAGRNHRDFTVEVNKHFENSFLLANVWQKS